MDDVIAVAAQHFVPLGTYGSPELGTVTGANHFFALTETTRRTYNLREGRDVIRISPPGTKHFRIVFLPDEQTLAKAYAGMAEYLREHYK